MKKNSNITKLVNKLKDDFNFFISEIENGNYLDTVISGLIDAMYCGTYYDKMKKLQNKVCKACLYKYEVTFKKNKLGITKIQITDSNLKSLKDINKFIKEFYPELEIKNIKKY